jgi:hypothetical protein
MAEAFTTATDQECQLYHSQASKPFEPLAINLRNAKQPSDGLNGCIANSLF